MTCLEFALFAGELRTRATLPLPAFAAGAEEEARTLASWAAKISAKACTASDVSPRSLISAVSAPMHPSGDRRGATTAPLEAPGAGVDNLERACPVGRRCGIVGRARHGGHPRERLRRITVGENRPQVGACRTANPDNQAAGAESTRRADHQLPQVLEIAHATELRAERGGRFQRRHRRSRRMACRIRPAKWSLAQHQLAIGPRFTGGGFGGESFPGPLGHDDRQENRHDDAHGRGSAQSVGLLAPPARF